MSSPISRPPHCRPHSSSVTYGDSFPPGEAISHRNHKFVLGITGGTGCGKTTLLEVIREKGGSVIDCDAVYHGLLRTDKQLLADIEAAFPGVVEEGVLQRKKLGALVFGDKAALKRLTAITGPVIDREVRRLVGESRGLTAIDAIGLIEGGFDRLCHTTVAITAPLEDRVKRLMARDQISEDYARNRIAAQKDAAWYAQNCNHILVNNGTKEEFQRKCLAFLEGLDIM